MEDLQELAALLQRRNELDRAIGALVGRPAAVGHLGEFIAARVFGLELEASATTRWIDGRFAGGPLAGRSVNVKWYPVQQGGLDLTPAAGPDFYLVLAGPRTPAANSRGTLRPLVIETVHLFETSALHADLEVRGVQIGTYASVRAPLWRAAAIYPEALCPLLPLSETQRAMLALFAP